MIRSCLICALSFLTLVAVGCAKSDDPRPKANVPIDGLMPSGGAVYDGTYLADQTKVEMLPARTIPEGSLLDDAVAVASAPEAPARVAQEEMSPVSAEVPEAPAPAAGGGGGFWQRVGMKAMVASMSEPRPVATSSDPDVDDEGEDGEEDEDDEDEDDEEEEDDEDEEEDED